MFSLAKLSQRTQLLIAGLILYVCYFSFSIPTQLQLLFFGAGLILTGIPHGAMDHLLYLQQHPGGHPVFKWIRFLSFYLGYAVLYGILWFINIELAILLFIGISAYHFGEMDLKNLLTGSTFIEKMISTIYGCLFLLNFLVFRWTEVENILLGFPGFNSDQLYLLIYIHQYKTLLLFISILWIQASLFVYYLIKKEAIRELFLQLLALAVLWLITFQLPILLGFGFYFNAWHATLSITEIKSSLGWTGKSWFYALKQSWFTNLAAFVFIGLMITLFYGDLNRMLAILFMSIAILTAPHIQVISSMFTKQGTTN